MCPAAKCASWGPRELPGGLAVRTRCFHRCSPRHSLVWKRRSHVRLLHTTAKCKLEKKSTEGRFLSLLPLAVREATPKLSAFEQRQSSILREGPSGGSCGLPSRRLPPGDSVETARVLRPGVFLATRFKVKGIASFQSSQRREPQQAAPPGKGVSAQVMRWVLPERVRLLPLGLGSLEDERVPQTRPWKKGARTRPSDSRGSRPRRHPEFRPWPRTQWGNNSVVLRRRMAALCSAAPNVH